MSHCGLDIACGLSEALASLIAPYILILIVLLVAIFVLPKAGKKGVLLSLGVIFFIVLWFGLIPGLPALRGYFSGG